MRTGRRSLPCGTRLRLRYLDVLGYLSNFLECALHVINCPPSVQIKTILTCDMLQKIQKIKSPIDSPPITAEHLEGLTPTYKGDYCNVFKVPYEGVDYAVKAIYLDRLAKIFDQEIVRIEAEIKTLYLLKHRGIIELRGHFVSPKVIGLVFPYFGRTLARFVKQKAKKKGSYSLGDFLRIFRNIGEAVAEIHAKGFIHRDLSDQNILIDDDLNTKIIDFGFAENLKRVRGQIGTIQYFAPEIIQKKLYNHKVDIWAFGILCYQLLYGLLLFKPDTKQEQSDDAVMQASLKVMKEPIREIPATKLLTNEEPSNQMLAYINCTLNYDPDKRPEVAYLLTRQVFGVGVDESENFAVGEFVRLKTERINANSGNSNLKQMRIYELEEALVKYHQEYREEKQRYCELLLVLLEEERRLAGVELKIGQKYSLNS